MSGAMRRPAGCGTTCAEREVEPERMQRLISLFKPSFDDPAKMRADLAGRPVYLATATTAEGTVRPRAANLLLNLPLASPS